MYSLFTLFYRFHTLIEVSVVDSLQCDSFHDGFRIYWQDQNYVDSEGCTYSLQAAVSPDNYYTCVYRGTFRD